MEITINSTLELLTEINKFNKLLSEDLILNISNINPDTQLNLSEFRGYSITLKGSVVFDTLTIDNCESFIYLEDIETDALNVKSSYVKLTNTTVNILTSEDATVDLHNSRVTTTNQTNSNIIKPKKSVKKTDSSQKGLKVQTITEYEVTAKQQRAMNKINAPYSEGIYTEYEQECNIRTGNTEIVVEGGLISCGGLVLEVEVSGVTLNAGSIPSNVKCIIVGEGNLTNDSSGVNLSQLKIITGTTTNYPTLTKNNLTTGSTGIHQTELGRFSKPSTGSPIIDYSNVKKLKGNIQDVIADVEDNFTNKLKLKQDIVSPKPFKSSNGLTVERPDGSSSINISSYIGGMTLENRVGTTLTIKDNNDVITGKGKLLYDVDADFRYLVLDDPKQINGQLNINNRSNVGEKITANLQSGNSNDNTIQMKNYSGEDIGQFRNYVSGGVNAAQISAVKSDGTLAYLTVKEGSETGETSVFTENGALAYDSEVMKKVNPSYSGGLTGGFMNLSGGITVGDNIVSGGYFRCESTINGLLHKGTENNAEQLPVVLAWEDGSRRMVLRDLPSTTGKSGIYNYAPNGGALTRSIEWTGVAMMHTKDSGDTKVMMEAEDSLNLMLSMQQQVETMYAQVYGKPISKEQQLSTKIQSQLDAIIKLQNENKLT